MNYQEIFDQLRARNKDLREEKIRERIKRLKALKKWFLNNRARIQDAVRADLNKPAEETDLTETYVVLSEVKSAIRNLRYWISPEPQGTSMPFIGTNVQNRWIMTVAERSLEQRRFKFGRSHGLFIAHSHGTELN